MRQRHVDGYADGPAGSPASSPAHSGRTVCLIVADLPDSFGVVWYVTMDDYPIAMGKAGPAGGTHRTYPFHSPFNARQMETATTTVLAAAWRGGQLVPITLSLSLP